MTERDVTIKDWSCWTGDEVLQDHRCAANSHTEVGVLKRGEVETGPPAWILALIEPATEDDVRKGVAPELGVPSSCTALDIGFCPFCGEELETLYTS